MVFLKPKLKNGLWVVRWLFGCIHQNYFYTEEEAEKFREEMISELSADWR
jgi:hypothetical protein